ncbi:MAG: DUF4956 domain-containing protein [Sphaerochaetaceae bacterium]|nr:DUF4956 domain-containing protein [Sphaerochaetaceae bacterium]
MLDSFFSSLFESSTAAAITVSDFLICIGASLVLGLILALAYMYKSRYTKSFAVTMALIPSVVCIVIMMVNGNIGAGVAVAGAFSLVRFRSAAGSAKEIGGIFLAMGAGLACGMGYIAFAVCFSLIIGIVWMLYSQSRFGEKQDDDALRTLRITIPEDLDYCTVFDDIISEYTSQSKVVKVKTTNLGSLFKITWNIKLKDPSKEKEFIDKLRCRNGNLEIAVSPQEIQSNEL